MKWIYHKERCTSLNLEKCNKLGEEGWEMCGIDSSFAWFKKEIPDLEFLEYINRIKLKQEASNASWYTKRKRNETKD